MTYPLRGSAFGARRQQATPGDVFRWHSARAGKHKFHLCLTWDYDFVFLSTPKDLWHRDNYAIGSDDLHFLKPTTEHFSDVSCRSLQKVGNEAHFNSLVPQHKGNLATELLLEVLRHMVSLPTLETEDAEQLGDVARVLSGNFDEPRNYQRPGVRRRF